MKNLIAVVLVMLAMPSVAHAMYYDKETNLYYNYSRDYDSSSGRYIESDLIGLQGGLNTYAYVTGNPLRYSDPFGLVKWSGTVLSTGAGPMALDVFTLTSECACGYRYVARVTAKSVGLTRGAGVVGQKVEFEDFQSCPDPYLLVGDYLNVSIGIAAGSGTGFGYTILGSAGSPGNWSWLGGLGAGAGVTSGQSTLGWNVRVPCSCER